MKTTRVSSKGQVVLPKAVRESRRWGAGTELALETREEGILLKELQPFPPTTIPEVFGCLKFKGKAKSIAQMNAAIARQAGKRRARGRY